MIHFCIVLQLFVALPLGSVASLRYLVVSDVSGTTKWIIDILIINTVLNGITIFVRISTEW